MKPTMRLGQSNRRAALCRCTGGAWLAMALAVFMLAPSGALAQSKVVPASRATIELSFAPVVKRVAPAVVNIFSKRTVRARARSPLFSDPFFQRFFGGNFGMRGVPRERIQSSLGSGVIVSEDGLIVTNHHVIKGAEEIKVVLNDRREFPAELVLGDERTDLAVLRINANGKPLPRVEFRDSDEAEVGDLVLAIGNPFGVGQTVTSGIVSAMARTHVGISDYSFFIQTDAAINPGNSGGALITLDGKLLGINTAIFSRGGGSVGIGFAIPSNMVRTVVASARRGGKVVRAWSGLMAQPVTQDLAEGFGLERPGGVVVSKVYPGGPADRAGLRRGDVILKVGGQPVVDVESFRFRIATRELGSSAALTIWRDHAKAQVGLPLAPAPETPPRNETRLKGNHPLAGAAVANLSPVLADELDMPGAWRGVIVTRITRGSPANRVGFEPRDIVVEVNGAEVGTVAELSAALERAGRRWRIGFVRDGRLRNVEING